MMVTKPARLVRVRVRSKRDQHEVVVHVDERGRHVRQVMKNHPGVSYPTVALAECDCAEMLRYALREMAGEAGTATWTRAFMNLAAGQLEPMRQARAHRLAVGHDMDDARPLTWVERRSVLIANELAARDMLHFARVDYTTIWVHDSIEVPLADYIRLRTQVGTHPRFMDLPLGAIPKEGPVRIVRLNERGGCKRDTRSLSALRKEYRSAWASHLAKEKKR